MNYALIIIFADGITNNEHRFRLDTLPLHKKSKTMPVTKNALIRIKYLDDLLSDRHHFYDIHDLTEKVNEALKAEDYPQVGRSPIEAVGG